MTPAVKQCQQHKIAFSLHQYQHNTTAVSYGLEAAEKLAVASERIFKTLVVETDQHNLAVAIIPVATQLNLKSMAKSLQCKKVVMAEPKRVQKVTGYVLGGVSPLGQKKALPTVIDLSSQRFSTLYISGGKRGLEIELSSSDLAKMIRGRFEHIVS